MEALSHETSDPTRDPTRDPEPDPEQTRPAPPRATGARFAAGAVLSERYRIVGPLGRGGMGEVYRADDLTLGESVALKFLSPDLAADPKWMARLRDEVRIARRVTHPHVCRVHDIGTVDDEPFISMEYIDGEDLSSLLKRIGRLPGDKAVQIARQLCAGLAAAHDKGVLHRDLKPANIMLDGRGEVSITDFGIAALAEEMTEGGGRPGTPAYMAPEVLDGAEATVRSDLYALGLVLHEVFTGGDVTEARTHAGDTRSVTSGTGTTGATTIELDPAVERVIMHCLQPRPDDRAPSAWAVASALPGGDPLAAALAAGEMPSPELVAAAGGARPVRPALATALFVVTLIGLLAAASMKQSASLYHHVPLDKPPAALIDRAQEILTLAGSAAAPVDQAHGYVNNTRYRLWSKAREPDLATRLASYAEPRPPRMFFWYRQSPSAFQPPLNWPGRGYVRATVPGWSVGGEAYVSLDLAGHLRRLFVVPANGSGFPESPPESDPPAPDWERWFERAGLEVSAFDPAEPTFFPASQFRSDRQWAWTGTYPDAPDLPMRVEAATMNGRLTGWVLQCPWDDADELQAAADAVRAPPTGMSKAADAFRKTVGAVGFPLVLILMGGATIVLFRRRLTRLVDRRGAAWLGLYVFCVTFGFTLLSGHSSLPRGQAELLHALSASMCMALGAWLGYVSIEPIVRRQWPTVLTGWARLLTGRWRDPLVGRNVLFGITAGVAGFVLYRASLALAGTLGTTPINLQWGSFTGSELTRLTIAKILVGFSLPVLMGFVYLLLLVFLRVTLRRPWLSAVAFVLLLPVIVFDGRIVFPLPWSLLVNPLWALMVLVLFTREGVLAVMACIATDMLLTQAPLSTDLGGWQAPATMLPVGVIVAVALVSFLLAMAPASRLLRNSGVG